MSGAVRPLPLSRRLPRRASRRGLPPGPDGSWPLRYDRLIQPVLDQQCVSCHAPDVKDAKAACFDLIPAKSYDTLVHYGKPSLADRIQHGYREGFSKPGEGLAKTSALLVLFS
jgi:hypothetical protein